MSQEISQRNVTRNQSTADYAVKRLFIFDNRFTEGIYKNNTLVDITLKTGMLVARGAVAGGLIPITADNLANTIGIAAQEGDVLLAPNATSNINFCTKGTIMTNHLVLPAGVTLDTMVGNKSLRDLLESIGFHLEFAVENTKFDN